MLDNQQILRVLSRDPDERFWQDDLRAVLDGDTLITREVAREPSVIALQRALIFLGYSTTSRGAFVIDGDFGPGTNRGIAQFAFDQQLSNAPAIDEICYPCTYRNAHLKISAIPRTQVTPEVLQALIETVTDRIATDRVLMADFEQALWHLNHLESRPALTCREVFERYGEITTAVCAHIQQTHDIEVAPIWVLAIIRQESAGIIRPRFEQHKLSRARRENPDSDVTRLRYESMSMGLGQVMGYHYAKIGAESPEAMLLSPIEEQIEHISRYLALARGQTRLDFANPEPDEDALRRVSKFYNGPRYEDHRYHEKLAGHFREFGPLMGA